ncbi:S1 domain [Sesbania bispinosa]|nr:S1 domain [Sesbania bispinosa]
MLRAQPLLRTLPPTWRILRFRPPCAPRRFRNQVSGGPSHRGIRNRFPPHHPRDRQDRSLRKRRCCFVHGRDQGSSPQFPPPKAMPFATFLPLLLIIKKSNSRKARFQPRTCGGKGAPKERELLCARIIDRPIRPLFHTGFYHEVQLRLSDLNLVYACTKDKTLMIDVQAREISEKDLEAGLRLAHPEAVKYIEPQIKLAAKAEGSRLDGRQLDEVRPVYCEAGYVSILHGSALFNRGETQFSTLLHNEVGKRAGLNRREVGHGTLAEKALLAVLPPEDDFPYTVRVNSEVMASDGSTSMATVCGGSMALMDAGIPVREHVAGVSVGLVSELDPCTGEIKDYRILTDILGLEDHLGDIDFKIAGTRKGVTAIQLDIKPAGIPLDIICECLEPAHKARLQILDHMEKEINAPRNKDGSTSPRLATLKYSNDAIRRLIGPMGALKRKMEEETGARMSVGDGTLTIVAKNQSVMDKILEKIDFIVGREIEVGGIYKGVVSSIKEYGAFVEFNGGQQGLLHISELSHEPVSRVSDVVSIGQQLSLMCIGQDVHGNIKLSLKATLPRPGGLETNDVDEGSTASAKEAAHIWAPVWNASSTQEQQNSASELPIGKNEVGEAKTPTSQIPSKLSSKGPPVDNGEQSYHKSKSPPKSKYRRTQDVTDSPSHSGPLPYTNVKKSKLSMQRESKSDIQRPEGDEKEAKDKATVTAKDLKLGTEVTAKVYQIRAHGLVLDLGGGLRGMYRFEERQKGL